MDHLRAVGFLLALSSGCYSPQLGNPSFFCHPLDNPPCPDGQVCVGGRCRSATATDAGADLTGSGPGAVDLATPGPGPIDLATPGPVDLTVPGTIDLATPSGDLARLLGCNDLLTCANACTTTACVNSCKAMATTNAVNLFSALDSCISGNCVGSCPGPACSGCVLETQTGTSPTAMVNGTCCAALTPAGTSCMTVVSPPTTPCGLCVDQLLACVNDPTL